MSQSHLRMGTRALNPEHWLLSDHLARSEIELRRRLLREQRDHVFACSPVAHAAAAEAASLIKTWLVDHPGPALPDFPEAHPLAWAGAQVQEDLCLMVQHDGAWHLEGAVLCFPSLWVLSEKIGRPTDLVHEPVPYFDVELSARVDTFFDRLSPDKPVWRRNFSLWDSPALFAPCHRLATATKPGDVDAFWVRSERQTLRRLPRTGAILFTIRVQMTPLTHLDRHPDRARDLAAWLGAPIGEHRRHELGAHSAPLLVWLDQVGRL